MRFRLVLTLACLATLLLGLTRSQCAEQQRRIASALMLYARVNGGYPPRPDLLVPAYIPDLPNCDGQAYRIETTWIPREPQAYTVACVHRDHGFLSSGVRAPARKASPRPAW